MTFPVSITKINVGATFLKSDGTPCTGTVVFRPSTTAVVDEFIFPTKTVYCPLDENGSFEAELVATDDPDWDVPGATYEVTERVNGVSPWRVYNVQIPYDAPGGILNLGELAPVDPNPDPGGGDPGELDPDLVAIANLNPSANDIIQRKAGNWTNRSPAQFKVDLSLSKSDVGLGSVDNVSDANKPISTAVQTELTVIDGRLDALETGGVDLDQDLVDIGSLTPTDNDLIQRKAGAWTNRTPAQVKTDLALSKSDVGLANVDNTSDVSKPISTATQTALDAKADSSALASKANASDLTAHTGNTSNPHAVTKTQVGLGNVDNTSDANKPVSTAQQTALNLKANLASPTFTGTVSGITKSMVGLGNVDNTADTAKPVSTAQQTALDLKAPLASPTFTGTVSGVTKGMVGLGNVDNTADTAKPVSTAQQTALDGKVNLSTVTTKGDLLVATASGAIARVGVGSNDQVLTADSTQTAGVKWATPAGGGGSFTVTNLQMLPMVSGLYYCTPIGSIGANTTGTLNTAYLVPFVPARSGNINGLSVDIAGAGSAGSLVRFGLASSNASYRPDSWIADFGTLAVGTGTNAQTLTTMSQAVTAGTLYWIGVVTQGVAIANFRAINGDAGGLIGGSTPPFGSVRDSGYVSTGWSGALTGAITINSTSNSPAVAVRMA